MLARYIEEKGIPTVSISLVREHTEKINPPRALWVPFPLGRPMGAPDSPGPQRRVLEAGLDLLARSDVPVLENFSDQSQKAVIGKTVRWSCPVNLPPRTGGMKYASGTLAKEISLLLPCRASNNAKKGRTVFGVSGLDIYEIATLIDGFIVDQSINCTGKDRSLAQTLKLAADDLKVWYYEAATPQPGTSSEEIAEWVWCETAAGDSLLKLACLMEMSNEKHLSVIGKKRIVPRDFQYLIDRIKD